MTEESEINNEQKTHIKTLFSRLTELIMSTCITKRGAADSIVIVCNWVGVVIASLILMVENKQVDSNTRADQITVALNKEIRKHLMILRGIKNAQIKSKESRIILPNG